MSAAATKAGRRASNRLNCPDNPKTCRWSRINLQAAWSSPDGKALMIQRALFTGGTGNWLPVLRSNRRSLQRYGCFTDQWFDSFSIVCAAPPGPSAHRRPVVGVTHALPTGRSLNAALIDSQSDCSVPTAAIP